MERRRAFAAADAHAAGPAAPPAAAPAGLLPESLAFHRHSLNSTANAAVTAAASCAVCGSPGLLLPGMGAAVTAAEPPRLPSASAVAADGIGLGMGGVEGAAASLRSAYLSPLGAGRGDDGDGARAIGRMAVDGDGGVESEDDLLLGRPSALESQRLLDEEERVGAGGVGGFAQLQQRQRQRWRGAPKVVARAYDEHVKARAALRASVLNFLLVLGDCFFLGMQPILVYMSKVDGKFLFDPVSVNFLTEVCKVIFAVIIILVLRHREGTHSVYSARSIWKAAKANTLLAVPAALYSVNNYLKFIMQLYFKPTTVKMLGNLKILVIALLLKVVMRRRFTFMQWEALVLLLIGICINQLPSAGSSGMPSVSPVAWVYTFFSVTIPSTASVFNEYALKSQFDTCVHLQNLFMYCYGVAFNLFLLITFRLWQGRVDVLNIFAGHSRATILLVANNALQGLLSAFFFKYADAILKKYSSTIATIFTAVASAALFGHTLTINFVLSVIVVFISMHQFFSLGTGSKAQQRQVEEQHAAVGPILLPPGPRQNSLGKASKKSSDLDLTRTQLLIDPDAVRQPVFARDASLLEMAAGAYEEANHHTPRHSLQVLPK